MFLIPKFKNTDYQIGLRYKNSYLLSQRIHLTINNRFYIKVKDGTYPF